MLSYEKSFESVVETYGGFPLKDHFLEAGKTVLAERRVEAQYMDNMIRIPLICRPYYTEEDLATWRDEGCTDVEIKDMRRATFHVDALIEVEDPAKGITDVNYEFCSDGEEVYDDYEIMDDHVTAEDYDRMIEMVKAFLNVAVEA